MDTYKQVLFQLLPKNMPFSKTALAHTLSLRENGIDKKANDIRFSLIGSERMNNLRIAN
jgi:hypothetical protein